MYSPKELSDLFNNQIDTLKKRGVPNHILLILYKFKEAVIKTALNRKSEYKIDLPFMPVIPLNYLGIIGSMRLIRCNNKFGHSRMKLEDIDTIDYYHSRSSIYYMFNISYDSYVNSDKLLTAKKCVSPYANELTTLMGIEQIISLCVHTNILDTFCVDSLASYNESFNNAVPYIASLDNGPQLIYRSFSLTTKKHIAPRYEYKIEKYILEYL